MNEWETAEGKLKNELFNNNAVRVSLYHDVPKFALYTRPYCGKGQWEHFSPAFSSHLKAWIKKILKDEERELRFTPELTKSDIFCVQRDRAIN